MDIRSKKSSKLAKLIITLVVILPAVFLVSLYPRMEKLMREKRAEYEQAVLSETTDVVYDATESDMQPVSIGASEESFVPEVDSLNYNFVNYAAEASYYLYGKLLQDAENREVNFDVLDSYGWINDFYSVAEGTEYYAEYEAADGTLYQETNSAKNLKKLLYLDNYGDADATLERFASDGMRGYLTMEFDPYGKISEITYHDLWNLEYGVNLYETARQSVNQFQNNVAYYLEQSKYNGNDMEWASRATEVVPKNFKIIFAISNGSEFIDEGMIIFDSSHRYYISNESIYWDMGVVIVIVVLAAIVALIALILPFFKKLNTGYEKLFCMPFELICGLGVTGFFGAGLMFQIMCVS